MFSPLLWFLQSSLVLAKAFTQGNGSTSKKDLLKKFLLGRVKTCFLKLRKGSPLRRRGKHMNIFRDRWAGVKRYTHLTHALRWPRKTCPNVTFFDAHSAVWKAYATGGARHERKIDESRNFKNTFYRMKSISKRFSWWVRFKKLNLKANTAQLYRNHPNPLQTLQNEESQFLPFTTSCLKVGSLESICDPVI